METSASKQHGKVYIVEHLDPELEHWSALEYQTIARECLESGSRFLLSSVPAALTAKAELRGVDVEQAGVEELFADRRARICLLDPAALRELAPEDGDAFDVFLFGGILGDDPPRGETPARLSRSTDVGRRLLNYRS